MKWLTKLLYASAGPTRSTRGESEESWRFLRPIVTWAFWVVLVVVVVITTRWIAPWMGTITDHQLLLLILFVCLWRR